LIADTLYKTIRSAILDKLAAHLPKELTYHSVHHTVDVETQAERIALNEHINEHELFLLKLACLYHDSGFLTTYREHEIAGCKLAREELPSYGIKPGELDIICGMIMATRIPQTPLNKLEEIICDADLDYLGRNDFIPISKNLYLELKAKGFVHSENDWNIIQVNFFKQHTYFTGTDKKLRAHVKQQHLEMIEALLEKK